MKRKQWVGLKAGDICFMRVDGRQAEVVKGYGLHLVGPRTSRAGYLIKLEDEIYFAPVGAVVAVGERVSHLRVVVSRKAA